ncbi:MAG: three-Cys-motif partner protein TcmP [Solirubrobacteraceae bacterium]
MARATFHKAADGYPARDAASWTEEKLMILDAYLNAFARACRTAGGWYALDLFAGTGLNWSTIRDREINGSALIALEAQAPEAIKVVVAENHAGAFEALVHRTERYGNRVERFNNDANKIVETMLGVIPRRAPAFAFLDPEGSELEWPTIEAIAAHKREHSPYKIEQLILFPTDMGFVRLAPDHPELVTRIYGHDGWRAIYARRESGKISAEEARGEYVRMYAEGFTRLGYETVLDRQIKKSNGQPMYFLIFATDNDAGERIMDWVFDRVRLRVQEELGQTTLFDMESGPRERRLNGGGDS